MMTHGSKNGLILAADGVFSVQDLWEPFLGNNCKSLIGKPKLFFIQACRGNLGDPGIMLMSKLGEKEKNPDEVDTKGKNCAKPLYTDLLVMYSSAAGHFSFRSSEGSWFIQALCKALKNNIHEELLTILIIVNNHVAYSKQSYAPKEPKYDALKQMPSFRSMLTKSLYFPTKL